VNIRKTPRHFYAPTEEQIAELKAHRQTLNQRGRHRDRAAFAESFDLQCRAMRPEAAESATTNGGAL
jgi:hypothetical protein